MQQNDIIEQFYQKKEKEDKAKWDRWIKEETVPKELNHRFYKIKCFYVSRLQKTYNKYWTNDLDVDSLVSNFSDSDKTFISGSMKSLSVKKKGSKITSFMVRFNENGEVTKIWGGNFTKIDEFLLKTMYNNFLKKATI